MSYNVSNWTTVRLSKLILPLDMFEEDDVDRDDSPALSLILGKGIGAEGDLVEPNSIRVRRINIYGDGSGYSVDALVKALKHSTGELVAFLTWEGGDSFTLLTSKDGVVSDEHVNIKDLVLAWLEKQETKQ